MRFLRNIAISIAASLVLCSLIAGFFALLWTHPFITAVLIVFSIVTSCVYSCVKET